MRAIYLHLNKAGLHYTAIAVFSGHPPDVRLYLYFHLQQQNGKCTTQNFVRVYVRDSCRSVAIIPKCEQLSCRIMENVDSIREMRRNCNPAI